MSLRKTALDLGIKRKDTCKLFYGIYPYSLTAKIPSELIEEKQAKIDLFWRALQARRQGKKPDWQGTQRSIAGIRREFNQKVKAFVAGLVAHNKETLKSAGWDYAFSPTTIIFYAANEQTVERLIRDNSGVFIRYTDPHNERCAAYLAKGDPKVFVRQHLFEGSHEYRISFKSATDYAALDERVERLKFGSTSYSYGAKSRTLYLSGEDDLFLARMGLEDQIERVTKCVLADQI